MINEDFKGVMKQLIDDFVVSDNEEALLYHVNNYMGCYENGAAFAKQEINDDREIPERIKRSIDYEKHWAEMQSDGGYFAIERDDRVYIYINI